MPTNVRDPRTIITPSAFRLDRELLGTPLASPWRRLWALLADLVLIGILTVLLDSIQLLVWGVVALFFLRMALKRRGRGGATTAVLLRVSAGCLGLTILSAVLVAWLAFQLSSAGSEGEGASATTPRVAQVLRSTTTLSDVGDFLAGLSELSRLERATTGEEAEDAALAVLDATRRLEGLDDEARLELLQELTPDDATWEDDDEEIYARALGRFHRAEEEEEATGEARDGEGGEEALRASVREEVEALPDDEALDAYAALLRRAGGAPLPDTGEGALRAELLRARLVGVVAEDTLDALEARLGTLSRERDRSLRELRATRVELEAQENSFVALLRDLWDQLGSAIGLWSIYFTVLTTVLAGQTPGKRAMGIRVVRLDGEPMNWWASFERAGGYVAGLATGLLGFAQLLWDPNRQCIHDKIVGTVVIQHGAEPVPGAWEEARGVVERGVREDGPS